MMPLNALHRDCHLRHRQGHKVHILKPGDEAHGTMPVCECDATTYSPDKCILLHSFQLTWQILTTVSWRQSSYATLALGTCLCKKQHLCKSVQQVCLLYGECHCTAAAHVSAQHCMNNSKGRKGYACYLAAYGSQVFLSGSDQVRAPSVRGWALKGGQTGCRGT